MTQEEFAKKIGFSRATLVKVENGKQAPTLRFIESLQYAFNLSDKEVKELMKLEERTKGHSKSD